MKFLILVLILIHVLIVATGGVVENGWWYDQLGLSQQGVGAGKIWQFFTYALLHGSSYHLTINCLLLWVLGSRFEAVVGVKKAMLVLLMGIVSGGVLQLSLSCLMVTGPSRLLVGISGGIMALLLSLTMSDPYRVLRPLRIRAKHFGMGFLIGEAILTFLDPALGIPALSAVGQQVERHFGESIFLVAHACHLGGGVAGLWFGKMLLKNNGHFRPHVA